MTTARAFRPRSWTAWASPSSPAGGSGYGPRTRRPDSDSAFSSPRPCWSARARHWPWKTASFHSAARSCGYAGPGPISSGCWSERRPDARGIVLTGYGNIATAVTAVKMGAFDYLSKPADADEVAAALLALEGRKAEPPENPMSADRVRWEHIQRIYELCGRNVSETARRLNMHRRTLQRILAKRAPK